MTETLFGCHFTDIWVSPSDWKTTTSKKALEKTWYVQCYFYDPKFRDKFPAGKPYRKKLNKWKTLDQRRAGALFYLDEIPQLFNSGYNHITGTYMIAQPDKPEAPDRLLPTTGAVKAIEMVWNYLREDAVKFLPKADQDKAKPFDDVRVAKNRFVKGLQATLHDTTPIHDLKLSDIKQTISYLKITDGYYNKFLSYMSKIFTELIEYGCIEVNPFKMFKKKKPLKKIREVLTVEQFRDIMEFLYERHYGLYRYASVFFMSGARSTELMMVQKKDVNIGKQEYKVTIKKSGQHFEEIKVVMLEALPLWRQLLSECENENDYLFSEWLSPGPVPIAPRQISRKWNKYVKKIYSELKQVNITADFYALKHLFLDMLDAMQHDASNMPENIAQIHAGHKSSVITNSVYLTGRKRREREALKKIRVGTDA